MCGMYVETINLFQPVRVHTCNQLQTPANRNSSRSLSISAATVHIFISSHLPCRLSAYFHSVIQTIPHTTEYHTHRHTRNGVPQVSLSFHSKRDIMWVSRWQVYLQIFEVNDISKSIRWLNVVWANKLEHYNNNNNIANNTIQLYFIFWTWLLRCVYISIECVLDIYRRLQCHNVVHR